MPESLCHLSACDRAEAGAPPDKTDLTARLEAHKKLPMLLLQETACETQCLEQEKECLESGEMSQHEEVNK